MNGSMNLKLREEMIFALRDRVLAWLSILADSA